MQLLLNLIWLIFGGLLLALGYAVAALVMLILIITIPFGIAAGRMAMFCVWPFGRTIVRRDDAGVASAIGNVIWFVLAGWWLALGHLVTGVLMCLTIIGIPLGLANFKLIPVSLTPLGRRDRRHRSGVRRRALGPDRPLALITCHVKYEIDPAQIEAFERFARRWMELVARHGGTHHGYFLPSEGASDIAYALFSFPSLAEYEQYRARFGADPEFVEADRIRDESGCVRRYERSFLRPLLP